MANNTLKAKIIHLSPEVVKALTIQAVNDNTTFKGYVQTLLTKKANVK